MSRNNNNNSRRAYSENAPRAAFGGADSIFERRFRIAFVLVIAIVVIFGFQLLCLQVFQAADNAAMGQAARASTTKLLAHRGTIYDRNGNVLATSVEVKSVYCDPTLISDLQEEAQDVASVLGNSV